jgi:hypothetical protein
MPSETKKAEAKAEREAAWWAGWWAKDFSWDGLAKLDWHGGPEKPWVGWSVTAQHRLVETADAPAGARPANLQDYLSWDAAAGEFLTPTAMRTAGLLVEEEGQPVFHILHLPPRYANERKTWKANIETRRWRALEVEAARLASEGAKTEFDEDGDVDGADCRAQLHGAVLRSFPRPTAPENVDTDTPTLPRLHLTANFVAFLGDCHAGSLDFGSAAGFADCSFFKDADFFNAQFSGGDADFFNAQFSGENANFGNAQFSGGNAVFDSAQFSGGNAVFDSAQFSGGNAYFNDAKFSEGEAYFSNAEFSGGCANFNGAQFSGGNASFKHVQFSGGFANFSDAQFSGGNAYFNDARFGQGSERSIFNETVFKLGFSSVGASFLGPVSFRGTQFGGFAQFGDAQQSGAATEAVREGAVFSHETSFRGAQFKSVADFARCRFPARADHRSAAFEGARFFESLDFKAVDCLPLSAFQGALLDKGILIGSDHPKAAQFEDALGDAIRAVERDEAIRAAPGYKKAQDADFESRGSDARFASLEAGCRVLKHAMAQISDRHREQAFFTMEMRARSRRPSTSWANRFLTGFYGRFSDYGGAVFRPLLASTGLATLSAGVYFALTLGFGAISNPELADGMAFGFGLPIHPALANSIALAAKNMLGPLGHLASQDAPFAYAGEAPRFWFNAVLGLLSVLQTIPSLILLFLSGLALRRQFQIN